MQYGLDDFLYSLKLLWKLPSQISTCMVSWRALEKIVRKTLTLVNAPELEKNVSLNLFFRAKTLVAQSWEMILGLIENNPFRLGAGLGGFLDQLLF